MAYSCFKDASIPLSLTNISILFAGMDCWHLLNVEFRNMLLRAWKHFQRALQHMVALFSFSSTDIGGQSSGQWRPCWWMEKEDLMV